MDTDVSEQKTDSKPVTNDEDGKSDKENLDPEGVKLPIKKKIKKFKPAGFKAPTATTTESSVKQVNNEGQTEKKKKKKPKGEKKTDANKSDIKPAKKKKEVKEKTAEKQENGENPVSKPKKKVEKSSESSKPVKHLTDEEYEALFNSAIQRIMNQPIEVITADPETSNVTKETSIISKKTKDMKKEDSPEDNFESLSHMSDVESITNGAGDAEEDEDSRDTEANNEADNQNNAELVQLENEITPSVSDDEIKPVIAPVKQKKTAPPKKKLNPVQLNLGVEKKKKNFSVNLKVKPELGKNKVTKKKELPVKIKDEDVKTKPKMKKVSKKVEMLNREIEPTGTWVQCVNVNCLKWRHLKDTHDPSILPERWSCEMNPDIMYNSCGLPEEDYDENYHQDTFIYTHFSEGSVVWAKMVGYPWWPAMIEIDPDFQEYFEVDQADLMLPTHYHVVFFDQKVSRAWIRTLNLKNFTGEDLDSNLMSMSKGQTYRKEVEAAKANANEALGYPVKERVKKFSFSARFKGSWARPSKEEQEGIEMTEGHFWKNMKQMAKRNKRKRKSSIKSLAESDDEDCDMGLELDDGIVDEILGEAESILNSADHLCSLEQSLPDSDDDPDFEPTQDTNTLAQDKLPKQTEEETDDEVQKKSSKILVKEEKSSDADVETETTEEPAAVQRKKKKSKIVVKEEREKGVVKEERESDLDKCDMGAETTDDKNTLDEPFAVKPKSKKSKMKEKKQSSSETCAIEAETETTCGKTTQGEPEKQRKKTKKCKKISEASNSTPSDLTTAGKKTTETDQPCETKKPKKKKFKTVIEEERESELPPIVESSNTSDEISKPCEDPVVPDESAPAPKSRKLKKCNLTKVERKDKNSAGKTENEPKKKKVKFEVVAIKVDPTPERLSKDDAQNEDNSEQLPESEQSENILTVKPLSLKRKAEKSVGGKETLKINKKKASLHPMSNPERKSNGDGNVDEKLEKKVTPMTDDKNSQPDKCPTTQSPEADLSESDSENELDLSKILVSKKQEITVKSSSIKQQNIAKTKVDGKEEYDSDSSDAFDCDEELDFSTAIPTESVTKSVNVENSDPFEALEE